MKKAWLLAALALSFPVGRADGQERDAAASRSATGAAAAAGAFLPFSQLAAAADQRATVAGLAGYDGARATGRFEIATEVRIWGPLTLRGGAVYTNGDGTIRPSFGGRVQILQGRRQGVDAAIGASYRPEGLTEPEGEIEGVLSLGRRAGGTYLLGNLLYGQDPEGRERDGEARVAVLRSLGPSLMVGFDGRLRFDLGSDRSVPARNMEPSWDVALGPLATALWGPLAFSLQAGGSGVRLPVQMSYGLFVMTGIGAAY